MKFIKIISLVVAAAMLASLCAFAVSAAAVEGDCNNDGKCDADDAIHLLYHVFFGNDYPFPKGVSGDYDGDGNCDADDAIYLLYHTFFPKDYPLSKPSVDEWTGRY